MPIYKRVLIKISGEALAGASKGEHGFGLDSDMLKSIASSVKMIRELGVDVALVVGGGNFWRGASNRSMDRTRADHMGMLATAMNALALADAIEHQGVDVRVQTAIEMRQIAEPFIRNKAIRHLEKGRVVIFGCGTGNPFFTTDTAAALRAAEIGADIILLAKNVDAVYSGDPKTDKNAVKYDTLSFDDILVKGLKVMDSTAASLCRDNNIKIQVFAVSDPENMYKAVCGEKLGTLITVD